MSFHIEGLRPLFSGGNADLQIGQRSDSGEYVVVKFLREYHLPHSRRTFAREVRILSQSLPGMMPILFADTNGERPYYVMPYFSSGSLTRYAGRLSAQQLLKVAIDTGRSLAALHARNISHGDFKPDNIMISLDGSLRLADPLGNGIGCTVLFSQNHGGTPGYWAPEVFAGQPISKTADTYSFGASLYHLLTGEKPVDGQRFDRGVRGQFRDPKLTELISTCCQLEPGARPTMQDVVRVLSGESWDHIKREREQKQLAMTCVLGVAALVLIATAG